MSKGTNCQCRCGCCIWVPPARNSVICKYCEGYVVFGREVPPKHTGD
jgi:hypothetical protein